ncbi:glycosyltransferase [Polynucleobacter sp. MWH-Adler-W8]|uniref:glycosyltransferase n=1 Tax=Polynucleobacter sp. MWH-Adler-W8 TaxID=1819727 RepID=UPI0009283ACC|nr:glycosyltransferase [Polynucleobacter sp. MWH-Adler-W8]OJI04848.1 hypothetical protein AOC28_06925 [Polynucleobacter sp. MWH-Adler-W8]
MTKKRVVISAVNFTEGGPLTVLLDSLRSAVEVLGSNWQIFAIVSKKELIKGLEVNLIEFPKSKRSWLVRIWLEYWYFKKLSKQLQPDLWLSLHDISPRVEARRQAVYCHNPSIFYRVSFREAMYEPKFLLFNLFYKYLYRINIYRNDFVIVQQDWIRSAFRKIYGCKNIVVAHPVGIIFNDESLPQKTPSSKIIFIYPALPRVFKNFDILCEAVASLPPVILDNIELRMTIDGSENRYARGLVERYRTVSGLRFIGRQGVEDMKKQYLESDVVMFPSKLETWGLPIGEAKTMGKPLLVADLPYARETVGCYKNVSFLNPDDPRLWADAMKLIALGCYGYEGSIETIPLGSYAPDWHSLWKLLVRGL